MPAKEVLYDEDARRALERGANLVADAVKVTAARVLETVRTILDGFTDDEPDV